MRGRKIYFIMGMVVLLVGFEYGMALPQNLNPIKLAIIDTVDREQRLYQPTIDILTSVGFKVTDKPLDLVIDQSITQIALPRYKAVFFIVGSECLGGVRRSSYLGQKVLRLVELYSK